MCPVDRSDGPVPVLRQGGRAPRGEIAEHHHEPICLIAWSPHREPRKRAAIGRSEEHTSELQSLMRISYAVFCLKKKKLNYKHHTFIPHITKSTTTDYCNSLHIQTQ